MGLRMVLVSVAVLLAAAGCSGAEPEPTACPVPSAPGGTTPTPFPLPTVPQENGAVCNGGTLTPSQAFELMSDAAAPMTVIDTRSESEYEAGHIAGALHLSSSSSSFDDQLDELPRDGTYLVYCRSGGVSARVVEQMLDMGFEHVCHIGTGFNGWQSGGFPVEKGAA